MNIRFLRQLAAVLALAILASAFTPNPVQAQNFFESLNNFIKRNAVQPNEAPAKAQPQRKRKPMTVVMVPDDKGHYRPIRKDSPLEMLAATMHMEDGVNGRTDKRALTAVGATIMTRVALQHRGAKSMAEVILDPDQFECWWLGETKHIPAEVWQEYLKLAAHVMKNYRKLHPELENVDHFYATWMNPKPYWARDGGLIPVAQIGGHYYLMPVNKTPNKLQIAWIQQNHKKLPQFATEFAAYWSEQIKLAEKKAPKVNAALSFAPPPSQVNFPALPAQVKNNPKAKTKTTVETVTPIAVVARQDDADLQRFTIDLKLRGQNYHPDNNRFR